VTFPFVLRLAASYDQLSREDCTVPERCEERRCFHCQQRVHYDPAAAIPILGMERIVCGECFGERYA
jgi:hypothetical protein